MEDLLIWLLASYGFSLLLVLLADKWADRARKSADLPQIHYRLLVRNSEQVLERVIRRLLLRSYWSGEPVRISLIDAGSTDDTGQIASIYERYPYFLHAAQADGQEEHVHTDIVIDLRQETAEAST
ncbi:glycosyltransferase family 2 protein [Brevibacillus sp. GCM10020057]|uniref:glycosyltransferase family 2 protein n=1 Tax=Brevibacillus sp. GCM10020057 TaxID=3317327 RepID=UPI00362F9803